MSYTVLIQIQYAIARRLNISRILLLLNLLPVDVGVSLFIFTFLYVRLDFVPVSVFCFVVFNYCKNCHMGGQLDELLASLHGSPLPCLFTVIALLYFV